MSDGGRLVANEGRKRQPSGVRGEVSGHGRRAVSAPGVVKIGLASGRRL